MSSRSTWFALCIAVMAGATSPVVQAQATREAESPGVRDHTVEEARRQHRAGVEAYAAGDYDHAIAAFVAAEALHSSPETAFNIAKTYEAAGDDSRALQFYREYLRRAPRAADREATSKRVTKLSARIAERGVQQVTFIVTPGGAGVFIDSEPVGSSPLTLDLRPGTHIVEFRRLGYAAARFEFELPPDRPVDVLATLAHEATAEASKARAIAGAPGSAHASEARSLEELSESKDASHAAPAVAPAAVSRSSVTRTLGFVALGASVAAIGGAITLEVMRSNAEADARREGDQLGYSEAFERMKSRQTMARVFAGAGGALAAVGGVLLAAASSEGERPRREGLAVGCVPARCHATLSGKF